MLFEDRFDAGRLLASRLREFADRNDVVVLGLPRGGVPVGYEVAKALSAPLDIFVVRKLGVPGREELAMGAIASGGIVALNQNLIETLGISQKTVDAVISREQRELERRERDYHDGRPPVQVEGRKTILVDDGLATGSSMHAAVTALRKESPAQIVVAVPVAAAATCSEIEAEVDRMICPVTPEYFQAVGYWYRDFSQISDEEVRELLRRAAEFQRSKAA
jgi:putative phosphoribosyl transferase